MIIWGGMTGDSEAGLQLLDDGAIYEPTADIWTELPIIGAPSARITHGAVWTDDYMLIWGGSPTYTGAQALATGARYHRLDNEWSPITEIGSPAARNDFAAVWTGDSMIVWGGDDPPAGILANGGRYYPTGNSWENPPPAPNNIGRENFCAVWTGSEVLVWGGRDSVSGDYTATGERYAPGTDTWTSLPTLNAPSARIGARCVWMGDGNDSLFVFGGIAADGSSTLLNDGGIYDLSVLPNGEWTPIPPVDELEPRREHSVIWTGAEAIVWGGNIPNVPGGFQSGARFDPRTGEWTPTSLIDAPSGRGLHTAVWDGESMIIWGGVSERGTLNDGARYVP